MLANFTVLALSARLAGDPSFQRKVIMTNESFASDSLLYFRIIILYLNVKFSKTFYPNKYRKFAETYEFANASKPLVAFAKY